MNSSNERRVLDKFVPDSTQKARDLKLIQYPSGGDLQPRLPDKLRVSPVFPNPDSADSIRASAKHRLAELWPPRVTFQLRAKSGLNTIFNNIYCLREDFQSCSAGLISFASDTLNLTMPQQMVQETTTTKWQKN